MTTTESSVIAVDVALIPPEWVQERARQINAALLAGGLQFDATHIPHISLAQLFLMRAALPLFIERVNLILRGGQPLPLHVLGVICGESAVSFLFDRMPELVSLHEAIMDGIQEWEEPSGAAEAFYSNGEPAREKDVSWVTNFRTEGSYKKFVPHITLGFGAATAREAPFDFTASEIGLFHLGRFCSCRVSLHTWPLG